MRTCMDGWRTNNHYFWSLVFMLLFTLERFVAVYRVTKKGSQDRCKHDTTTDTFEQQSLLWAISRLIDMFFCCPLVPTCHFNPAKWNYEIVADCKMRFSCVFPQCRALSPLLKPVNRDEVPASQTVCQFCLPMCHQLGWIWLTVYPRTGGNTLFKHPAFTCTSSALSLCELGEAPASSNRTHPPSKTLEH